MRKPEFHSVAPSSVAAREGQSGQTKRAGRYRQIVAHRRDELRQQGHPEMIAAIGLAELAVGRMAQEDISADTFDQPVGTVKSDPAAHPIPDKAAGEGGKRRHRQQDRQRRDVRRCRHAEEQQQHMRGRHRQDLLGEGEAEDAEQAEAENGRQRTRSCEAPVIGSERLDPGDAIDRRRREIAKGMADPRRPRDRAGRAATGRTGSAGQA